MNLLHRFSWWVRRTWCEHDWADNGQPIEVETGAPYPAMYELVQEEWCHKCLSQRSRFAGFVMDKQP